jgi:hypothetical protein
MSLVDPVLDEDLHQRLVVQLIEQLLAVQLQLLAQQRHQRSVW